MWPPSQVRAGYPEARTGNYATKDDARLGRDPAPGGSGRAPRAAAFPLPGFPGRTAPEAVNRVVAERELQALAPHSASGADLLGPRDLPLRRADRRDREEEIGVRGQ